HQLAKQRNRFLVWRATTAASSAGASPTAASSKREVERRPILLVAPIELGAFLSRVLNHGVGAPTGRVMENRLSDRVECIDVDAVVNEQPDGFERFFLGCTAARRNHCRLGPILQGRGRIAA